MCFEGCSEFRQQQGISLIVLCVLQVLFFTPYSFASPSKKALDELSATRTKLMALSLNDSLTTEVPQEGVFLIQKLKNNLENFITIYLEQFSSDDSKSIQRDLNALFDLKKNESSQSDYGRTLTIAVKKSGSLLFVVSTFSIQCGTDSQLLVFQRKNRRWESVFRWESKPYTSIDGALGTFQYKVASDAFGGWYILAADTAPWCSSTWTALRYYILKMENKKILFKKEYSIWLGNSDPVALKATSHDFEVRFTASSIDPDIHSRTHIHHYIIDADTISRQDPVALSPRDFIDEWVSSSWEDASKWCVGESCVPFRSIHEKLQELQRDAVCSFEKTKNPSSILTEMILTCGESSWNFTIKRGKNFRLLQVKKLNASYPN